MKSKNQIYKNSKGNYMIQYNPLWHSMHQVIGTDYENYAVVYGCDNIWWTANLFNYRYSLFLSKHKHLEGKYVSKAKQALNKVGYEYDKWWLDNPASDSCGYHYDPTVEQDAVKMFGTTPLWSEYGSFNSYNNARFRTLFDGTDSNVPSGYMTD
mmetsp:Transcript_18702/g.28653  ORF Transcript_18702/g.28653 Transcript_18702/m.28653 type:complete len:154 (+) Transcript_18702:278-739(+)|eukprot:CAMPEP_0170493368 /NCGR_PEP_ID=MMETSP0208-20121228/13780_1 /TAXON_ID=197538 /ORGANISM="Strombidium inclinatum, Strain S3" /LENGTH=153 /DNA_ID=CAMNT_0010769289 /DNA_START=278 /DNA_END=739 /DNA_ORIENTATION=+